MGCCFVPKYDVLDANGTPKYRLRPDTCVAGLCVQCRCDGKKGKCCRVPFVIRDPVSNEPMASMRPCLEKPSTPWSMSCGPDGATSVVRKRMPITSVFLPKSVPTKRRSLLDPPC